MRFGVFDIKTHRFGKLMHPPLQNHPAVDAVHRQACERPTLVCSHESRRPGIALGSPTGRKLYDTVE